MSLHSATMNTLKVLQLPASTWKFINSQKQHPITIFLETDTTPNLIVRLWDVSLNDPYTNFIVAQENYFEISQVPVNKDLLDEFLKTHSDLPKEESFALTAKQFIDWVADTRQTSSFKVSYI